MTWDSVDEHIDYVLAIIDTLCWMENWTLLDAMLAGAEPENMDATIAAAYASYTHMVRKKLPSRESYIERCRTAHPREGLWETYQRYYR